MAKALGVILVFVLITLALASVATLCVAVVLPLFLLFHPFGFQGVIVYVLVWVGLIEWFVRKGG